MLSSHKGDEAWACLNCGALPFWLLTNSHFCALGALCVHIFANTRVLQFKRLVGGGLVGSACMQGEQTMRSFLAACQALFGLLWVEPWHGRPRPKTWFVFATGPVSQVPPACRLNTWRWQNKPCQHRSHLKWAHSYAATSARRTQDTV